MQDTNYYQQKAVDHVWHACTEINALDALDFPVMEKGNGCFLYDTDGKEYIDAIASWWCVNLGHSHPRLVEAMQSQAGVLQHSILGGMSHPKIIELAEKLAQITPGELNHSFFCGDGASAVEAALKMALQYWKNTGVENKTKFVGLQEGYHGDTLGTIGVGYVDKFHRDYASAVIPAFRATSPHCLNCPLSKDYRTCKTECFEDMEEILRKHHHEIAAVVVEPLIQGAAGVRIYNEDYLRKLSALCKELNVLIIADEIAVGFGRTGKMFACEKAGITPDIMTVGKGLTGGMIPMSAAIVTPRLYNSFRNTDNDRDNTFYHSHTYGGNPIAAATALAAIEAYQSEKVFEAIPAKSKLMEDRMNQLSETLHNSPYRVMGMVACIEINEAAGGAELAASIARKAKAKGLLLRPRGNAVYIWPPLNIEDQLIHRIFELISDCVRSS